MYYIHQPLKYNYAELIVDTATLLQFQFPEWCIKLTWTLIIFVTVHRSNGINVNDFGHPKTCVLPDASQVKS